jgi:hypothetical protein
MNCPPLLLRLDIARSECPRHTVLWLPIFLAWIILGAIFLALMPLFAFIALLVLPFGWAKTVLLFIPLVCNVICNLHGMEINIEKKDSVLFLSFK